MIIIVAKVALQQHAPQQGPGWVGHECGKHMAGHDPLPALDTNQPVR
ncbi:MAG: hypothetical protein ACRCXM_16550 [Beijerinckiaceae bacterium]